MQTEDTHDAIIAGAGPVGLFVACELARAGVSTLVIEQKTNPLDDPWVMGTLGVRAINHAAAEILYRRDLLDTVFPLTEQTNKRTELRECKAVGHFAGNFTDPSKVDFGRWRHILPAPTATAFGGAAKAGPLNKVLFERAEALGVKILCGRTVSHYEETASAIKVWTTTPDDPSRTDEGLKQSQTQSIFTAQYLVGADGGRSAVRHAGNFPFTGSEATWTGYSIDCTLTDPDVLRKGFNRTTAGMYMRSPGIPPFDAGLKYFIDVDGGAGRNVQPVTKDHAEAMMRKVSLREDLVIEEATLMGSFTDRTKQAETYRRGRVFLAGDSAHIHAPIGGQGLNLGLGDAINLGWKLAAVIQGRAADPEALLDSYSAERVPLGRQVLDHTRVQTMGVTPGLHGQAIYNFVTSLNQTADGATFLAERVNWYDRKLNLGNEHWLVGRSAPDFEFVDGSRLGSKLLGGKWVVVDFGSDGEVEKVADDLKAEYVNVQAKEMLGVKVAVVRPDGVVAFANDGGVGAAELRAGVGKWVTV